MDAMHIHPNTRPGSSAYRRAGDPPSVFAWLVVGQLAIILAMIFI